MILVYFNVSPRLRIKVAKTRTGFVFLCEAVVFGILLKLKSSQVKSNHGVSPEWAPKDERMNEDFRSLILITITITIVIVIIHTSYSFNR